MIRGSSRGQRRNAVVIQDGGIAPATNPVSPIVGEPAPRFRRRSTQAVSVSAVVGILALAGTQTGQFVAASTTSPTRPGHWMVATTVITQMRALGGSSTITTDAAFNHSNTFCLGADRAALSAELAKLPSGYACTPMVRYTSEVTLASELKSGTVPARWAVMYDNECGSASLTPLIEQSNPPLYEKLAMTLAHSQGRFFSDSGSCSFNGGSRYQAATYADAIDAQLQNGETDTVKYAAATATFVNAARALNPAVSLYEGLSTNPPNAAAGVDPRILVTDEQNTVAKVNGYWLNVPSPSPGCTQCGLPRYDIAVQFLAALGY